jgi:hypothetical protein
MGTRQQCLLSEAVNERPACLKESIPEALIDIFQRDVLVNKSLAVPFQTLIADRQANSFLKIFVKHSGKVYFVGLEPDQSPPHALTSDRDPDLVRNDSSGYRDNFLGGSITLARVRHLGTIARTKKSGGYFRSNALQYRRDLQELTARCAQEWF